MSEKFRLVEAEKAFETPVKVSCELLGVSRSGYYDWERRVPCQRELEDAWITEKIKEIHRENRGVYGAPRIHAELRMAYGIRVGKKRVARLMKQAGISGLMPKRRGKQIIRVPGSGSPMACCCVTSRLRSRTRSGLRISPRSQPARVGFILPPFRICSLAGSLGGRWPTTCVPSS